MTAPRPLPQDSRHAAFRAAIASVCIACLALPASAMDRQRPRTHPTAPDREPVPVHHVAVSSSRESKHATHTAAKKSSHEQPASTKSSRSKAEAVAAHSKHRPLPAMKVIGIPEPSRTTTHKTRTVVLAKAEPKTTPRVEAKPTKQATFDDFARAAAASKAEAANSEVAKADPALKPATSAAVSAGVSHPDEMDDEKPLEDAHTAIAAVKHAPELPKISAAKALPPPPADARVNGFGAEGVPVSPHRTLAATMAAHRAELIAAASKAPEPTAAERVEITEEAVKPMVLPSIYDKGGRLVMPAALKGSRDILIHQNTMATAAGLERIRDDDDLRRLINEHQLVRVPESASLDVNDALPIDRRYARPWTARFAADTAKAFANRFGEPLRLNSAVRTVSYQLRLMRTNGNAAAVSGDTASPHLTGQAIDFGKGGMTKAEIAWMRAYLAPLMDAGKIDVEEEFQQACFHISVYRSYLPAMKKTAKVEVASADKPARRTPVAVTDDSEPNEQ